MRGWQDGAVIVRSIRSVFFLDPTRRTTRSPFACVWPSLRASFELHVCVLALPLEMWSHRRATDSLLLRPLWGVGGELLDV